MGAGTVSSRAGTGGADLTTNGRDSWIILLEAAPDGDASLVDIGTVRLILSAMGDEAGVALHAPDRVAVQVRVQAADVALALSQALRRWRVAAAKSAPAGWHVVRAEVLTPEEFTRDCEVG